VLDISDPSHPLEIGAYNTFVYLETLRSIKISDDYAYVATAIGGLTIFDIHDPIHPILTGRLDTPGYAFNLAVSGELIFIVDKDMLGFQGAGLVIADVSDPANPVEISSYYTSGTCTGIAIWRDLIFIADLGDSTTSVGAGIWVLDASDPYNPKYLTFYSMADHTISVGINESLAYIGSFDQTANMGFIDVLDILDPKQPLNRGALSLPLYLWAGEMLFQNNLLFMCGGGGLKILDISYCAISGHRRPVTPP
jgi:hypothetical protein